MAEIPQIKIKFNMDYFRKWEEIVIIKQDGNFPVISDNQEELLNMKPL